MNKQPYCQYTIKLSYGDDHKLQEALRLLQVENKEDLQDALRCMLMETVEELLTEKNEKKTIKKKRSAWRYMTPVVGGLYLLRDVAKLKNKLEELNTKGEEE